MKFLRTDRSFRYLLVLWLGLSLVLLQTLNIHMHAEHMHDQEAVDVHHADLHPGLTIHDDADHHANTIDVGLDSILKNSSSSFFIALIAFFSILLISPARRQLRRRHYSRSIYIPFTCLLQPPLRAPPCQ